MSLADELLADLEDDDDIVPEIKTEDDSSMMEDDVKPTPLELAAIPVGHTVRDVAKLHDSPQLLEIMDKIDTYANRVRHLVLSWLVTMVVMLLLCR